MSSASILTGSKLMEIERKYLRSIDDWRGKCEPSEHNALLTGLMELLSFPFTTDVPIVRIDEVFNTFPNNRDDCIVPIGRLAKLMGVYEIDSPIHEIVSVWFLLPMSDDVTEFEWVMLRCPGETEENLPQLAVKILKYTRDEYVARIIDPLRRSKHVDYSAERVATSVDAAIRNARTVVNDYADIFDLADDMYRRTIGIRSEEQAVHAIRVLTGLLHQKKIKMAFVDNDDASFTIRLEPQASCSFNREYGPITKLVWTEDGHDTTVCQLIANSAEFMNRFDAVFARHGYRLNIVADRSGDLVTHHVDLIKWLKRE